MPGFSELFACSCSGVGILRIVCLPLVQVPGFLELSTCPLSRCHDYQNCPLASCSGARIIRTVLFWCQDYQNRLFASCSGARIIRIVRLPCVQVPGLLELPVCLLFRCQGWKLGKSERWWWWVWVRWSAGPEGAWCPRPDLPHGLPCLHSDALCRTCGKSENLWLSWVRVAVQSVSKWFETPGQPSGIYHTDKQWCKWNLICL